jgi:RNA polymerase sigma factor (sigma-70 family)
MEAIKTFSDTELVDNLRSGKKVDNTIRYIYRSYFDGLHNYIINNNGSRQDAEDIFQEVVISFIQLVRDNKFRGESSISTLLFSINRHLWLNELKKRKRTLAREEKYEKAQEKTEMNITSLIHAREMGQQVVDLMNRLGDTCKQILLMSYYENLSTREMLEALNYENEQVVRNKKYKCMKQLEQIIAADPILKQKLKQLMNG